ncbi:hypothetical protein ACWEOO_12470 [Kribbella sp. NPDC004138]
MDDMVAAIKQPVDTRKHRPIGADDGVYFLGRPDWLTDDLLSHLRQEAQQQRAGAEKIREQHFAELGTVGTSLCESSELLDFVVTHSQPVTRSGKANYRYYDIPHSHVTPHLDTDQFGLNVIIMLEHDYADERRSALLLFAHGPQGPVTLQLEPGEVILFDAAHVVHARTPISDDGHETAVNMGIGFTPEDQLPNPGFWHPTHGWSPA